MENCNVSVVIPCFNCVETINKALMSIYEQTIKPIEVILVDDKSTDETLSVLYDLQKLFPENWVKVIPLEVNAGPSGARNSGWDIAQGKYVALLDSDDIWHPQKLEIQIEWMEKNPEIVLSGHEIEIITENNDDVSNFKIKKYKTNSMDNLYPDIFSKNKLLFRGNFSTSSVVVRKDIATRFSIGKFYGEDRLLLLEIAFSGGIIHKLPLALEAKFKETYGEGGLSQNIWLMEKGELDTFKKIWRLGYISFGTYIFVCGFSLLKYLRRLLLSKLRA